MDEEPSLPRLPAISWDEQSQSFSNNPRKRVRRQRRGASPLTPAYESSDPAVFSSDDDPGLDNYVEGRRKKRYVGSWFQQRPASADSATNEVPIDGSNSKRTLKRQFDSGVYLGSDCTEDDEVVELLDDAVPSRLPQLLKKHVPSNFSQAELVAQQKIQDYLDRGDESIDLWSLGLDKLSDDTVNRLQHFSCIPVVAKDVSFENKEPELRMFLAANSLERLPGALFDLTYLTVLSLRGNRLIELPSSISKLVNLKQLNLSQNRLRSLPAEMLDLLGPRSKLQSLSLHPNPFVQPELQLCFAVDDFDSDSGLGPVRPVESYGYHEPCDVELPTYLSRHLGHSPVQVSDSCGRIVSRFKLPSDGSLEPTDLEVFSNRNNSDFQGGELSKLNSVPSLVELILRACYRSTQIRELESYLVNFPEHIQALGRRAVRQHEAGGLVCSRCRRLIIVPVVEWIEWRDVKTVSSHTRFGTHYLTLRHLGTRNAEMAIPFLRRACSWNCGPSKGHEHEAEWSFPNGFMSYSFLSSPP